MRGALTQLFRSYAALAVAVAGFTALWAIGVVDVSMPLVGYAWLAVAAVGGVVALGMVTKQEEALEADASDERIEQFEESSLTGWPLEGYVASLALWAAVSFGWILGGQSPDGLLVVGYGWLAIAVYGLLVGIGIVNNHRKAVAKAIDPTETLDAEGR